MQPEETSLERARRHLTESANRISNQQGLVQTMQTKGLDTTRALQLLDYFRRLHAIAHEYHAHEETRTEKQDRAMRGS
jgi:hypothetical protein